MKQFEYKVLRYQPDRVSGEFVNVGLLLFEKSDNLLKGKVVNTTSRIHALYPNTNGKWLLKKLKDIEIRMATISRQISSELNFDAKDELEAIANDILTKDSSALYFTETFKVLDLNIDTAFNDLFHRMITSNLSSDEFHHYDDKEVWSQVYRKHFENIGLADQLQKHTIITSSDTFTFEHSIKNEIWHLFEPVSFDLTKNESIKNKVYKWMGKLQELGQNHNEEFKVYLMAKMPESNEDMKYFIEQKLKKEPTTISSNKAELIEENKIDDILQEIKSHLN
jgi:hypothetical protein